MSTLKRGFIILVAGLFLAVVSVGAQAATTVKSSKSNSSDRSISDAQAATTVTQDPTTKPNAVKNPPVTTQGSGDPMKGLDVTKAKPVK